jgi:hypothetical protein
MTYATFATLTAFIALVAAIYNYIRYWAARHELKEEQARNLALRRALWAVSKDYTAQRLLKLNGRTYHHNRLPIAPISKAPIHPS